MNYRVHIAVAAGFSVVAHLILLAVFVGVPRPERVAVAAPEPPVVLNLQREESVRRLIESVPNTLEPVDDTEYISAETSRAQDMSDETGDETRPASDEPRDVDQLAKVSASPVQEVARPVPEPVEETPEASEAQETPEEPPQIEPMEPREDILATREKLEQSAPADERLPEPVKVAQAQTTPGEGEFDAPEAVRDDGGARAKGFTNFEAKDDQFAPYMLEIRKRVERRWRTALHLKYSGTGRTSAELECAINPMGKIIYVRIVDPGHSVSYAALCKEAIERAGPFPPFPFEVPELYRNKNLEIRWRFSFM